MRMFLAIETVKDVIIPIGAAIIGAGVGVAGTVWATKRSEQQVCAQRAREAIAAIYSVAQLLTSMFITKVPDSQIQTLELQFRSATARLTEILPSIAGEVNKALPEVQLRNHFNLFRTELVRLSQPPLTRETARVAYKFAAVTDCLLGPRGIHEESVGILTAFLPEEQPFAELMQRAIRVASR